MNKYILPRKIVKLFFFLQINEHNLKIIIFLKKLKLQIIILLMSLDIDTEFFRFWMLMVLLPLEKQLNPMIFTSINKFLTAQGKVLVIPRI